MDGDTIELWMEAIDAREELEFQEQMKITPLTNRHDKPAFDARKAAIRASEYRWHDKLRMAVDLRKMRPKTDRGRRG